MEEEQGLGDVWEANIKDLPTEHQEAALRKDSIDEGLAEDLVSSDGRAVEHLSEGLISHYLPSLQSSKVALQELTQNQVVLLDTLDQEISKFKECNSITDINALVSVDKRQAKRKVCGFSWTTIKVIGQSYKNKKIIFEYLLLTIQNPQF
ncbi:hypothetical protein GDO86_006320 [Hymenochirus boettgeri]|uniref:Uncharacterized protein n=1 Tax=Hymenochirus boettgeri TaxID=247094 RepID=A0A8T2J5M4_9PIPI|nr:hypothetical protein GDO86_006320 [Hymenochirus boettgeri]